MNVNPQLLDVHVPREWWYRCFGGGPSAASPCRHPARWYAPLAECHDAVTFYCDEHRPTGAREIAREGEYLELCLGGMIVLGASTLGREEAKLEALAAIQEQLAQIGATFVAVQLGGSLRRPLPILGPKRPPDAPGAARNGDRAGGRQ